MSLNTRCLITGADIPSDIFQERPGFVSEVRKNLENNKRGLKEYELIQALRQRGCFDGWISSDGILALFQQHFAVMHVLYRLREDYAEQGLALSISPLSIQLYEKPPHQAKGSQLSLGDRALADFYGDWSHYESATPETVATLLKDFWQRYAAADQTSVALQALGLKPNASWHEVQSRYRRLAAEHHPDKGGDSVRFTQVREAYETLKKVFL